MRRLLIAGIVLLPAVLLVAVFARPVSVSGPPFQVTSAIADYVQYRASHSLPTSGIQRIVPASRPGYFTPQMSRATFGNSVYFQTDHRPTVRRIPATATPWMGEGWSASGKPLPFPPVALWCVRLKPAQGLSLDIVYVAQHEDDYKVEWIVHEPIAETVHELEANLATLGCDEVESP